MDVRITAAVGYLKDAELVQHWNPKPTLTGYARLETLPSAPSLAAGLAAPLADPLWLLARQRQFGEWQGEDAGSPVGVSLNVQSAPIDALLSGTQARELDAAAPPPEVWVEAEPIWTAHPRLDAEAGLRLLQRARAAGLSGLVSCLRAPERAAHLAEPEDAPSDPRGRLWHLLLDARTPSARRVLAELYANGHTAGAALSALPPSWPLPPAEVTPALAVVAAWLTWVETAFTEGPSHNPAWRSERLEYRYALRARARSGTLHLVADDAGSGQLDWHQFVAEAAGPAGDSPPPPSPPEADTALLPVPVRYPGMPADRYWEFEDGRVHFAGLEASPSSLTRLMLTEFALAYGNDWFVLPVDLPVGALHHVQELSVRDSFGVTSPVPPSDRRPSRPGAAPWSLFELSTRGAVASEVKDMLCLPDALDGRLESAPLEEVRFVRDEMANLAWAIEHTVQGRSGEPIAREREADRMAYRQHLPAAPGDPALIYRLATPVPAHWIPLLPRGQGAGSGFHISLQRGGMVRYYSLAPELLADPDYAAFLDRLRDQDAFIEQGTVENGIQTFVFHPRGLLLRADPTAATAAALATDSLSLAEEEVPRAGACVTRRFQYARSADGRAWLWIGRSKRAGRGEGHSGLAFDRVGLGHGHDRPG